MVEKFSIAVGRRTTHLAGVGQLSLQGVGQPLVSVGGDERVLAVEQPVHVLPALHVLQELPVEALARRRVQAVGDDEVVVAAVLAREQRHLPHQRAGDKEGMSG
jgi:hypothetical protein